MGAPTQPVWGIIGGGGPRAGVHLTHTLWAQRAQEVGHPLCQDADYPAVLLDTRPLAGLGPHGVTEASRFAQEVAQRAFQLVRAGATRVVLACVSGHVHVDSDQMPSAWLDLRTLGLTALAQAPSALTVVMECRESAGQLAKDLAARGQAVLQLSDLDQARVDALIQRGMAGQLELVHARALWAEWRSQGVTRVVLGCSDLGGGLGSASLGLEENVVDVLDLGLRQANACAYLRNSA